MLAWRGGAGRRGAARAPGVGDGPRGAQRQDVPERQLTRVPARRRRRRRRRRYFAPPDVRNPVRVTIYAWQRSSVSAAPLAVDNDAFLWEWCQTASPSQGLEDENGQDDRESRRRVHAHGAQPRM